jgi:hypothetical protein
VFGVKTKKHHMPYNRQSLSPKGNAMYQRKGTNQVSRFLLSSKFTPQAQG